MSGPAVAPWLLQRLRCMRCGGGALSARDSALVCDCGASYPVDRGVADFLGGAHPSVRRERSAVAAIDRGEATVESVGDAEAERRRHLRITGAAVEEALDRVAPEPGSVVVELGADDCWASPLLLRRGCRVVAVDITEHLHQGALDDPDHGRLLADMNRLPLADGAADLVLSIAAAHHSWDLTRTFAEARRLLRPGGRLALCSEPMPSWPRYLLGLGAGAEERRLGINEGWIPRSRWLRLARRAGFAAEILLPTLDGSAIRERLRRRKLPTALAPLGRALAPWLQVSAHLLAARR